jgi:transcriptional regulator with PAS, ATPase and Fis domain
MEILYHQRFFLNSASKYAIRKVQENQKELEMNGTYHTLVYADDTDVLGENMNTIRRKKEVLLEANRDVGPEINTEETKYMYGYACHTNAGQTHNFLTANKSLKMWQSSST